MRDDEDDYGPPVDFGVRSSDMGSFIPEGTYRPIPIVWLTAAWVVHSFSLAALYLVLINKAGIFTLLTTAIITFWVTRWTFGRGMAEAGTGWKVATVVLLTINWLLVAMGAYGR
jgi:hypothetical protein